MEYPFSMWLECVPVGFLMLVYHDAVKTVEMSNHRVKTEEAQLPKITFVV